MQAKEHILDLITRVYAAHRGMRLLCIPVVLSVALLLFLLADNLPPFAWRLLAGLILLSVTIPLALRLLLWLTRRLGRLVSAPTYDRTVVPSGSGAHLDDISPCSYGRTKSFPAVPAVDALLHLPTVQPTAPLLPISLPTWSLSATKPKPSTRRPTIQLIVSADLDVGLKRKGKPNEDSLLALQNTHDGMGGHENGQKASRLVIQSLNKTVGPSITSGTIDDDYTELLAEGVHQANLEVYHRNCQDKANMGTTVAAALVVDTTAYIVSAGDSRAYLYCASSGLLQVTRDHSTVALLVEKGLIQPEEIYTHPRRNEIYRSLGQRPREDLDKLILALQPDDLLLLCSDGLWEMVRDARIRQIIASNLHQPTQISAALVQAALEGGGKDNISVISVYVKALEEARAPGR